MADFIMAVTDRARFSLDLAESGVGAVRFQAVGGYAENAIVSPDGYIRPLRAGPVLIEVIDLESGESIRELIGVIRKKARFEFDRGLQLGGRSLRFLVVSTLTGVNLGGATTGGGSEVIDSSGLPGHTSPDVYGVVAADPVGGVSTLTWRTPTSASVPYRVDVTALDGTVLSQLFTGALAGPTPSYALSTAGLPVGEYQVTVTNLLTQSTSAPTPLTLEPDPLPLGPVALAMDGNGNFIASWSAAAAGLTYTLQLVSPTGTVVREVQVTATTAGLQTATISGGGLPTDSYVLAVNEAGSPASQAVISPTASNAVDPNGGTNLAASAPAFASSTAPGTLAANVTDGQVGTLWSATTGAPGEWVAVDLGAPMQAYSVQFVQGNGALMTHIEAANTPGGPWVALTGPTDSVVGPGNYTAYDLPGDVAYRYYRLVNDTAPADGNPWSVDSLLVYDYPADGFGTSPYGAGGYGL